MARADYQSAAYQRRRRELLGRPCWKCGAPADSADHYPPLSSFPPGQWRGELRPICMRHQHEQGGELRQAIAKGRRLPIPSRLW